jgi:hypothetical protein
VAQDHNDIYSIVERLRILEEGLTPVNVKHGLNAQQKSVDQLSATFKPKTVAVLTAKQDPKNPLAGKLVGDSVENDKEPVEEDVLEKVKSSLTDYLKSIEDKYKDANLKDKNKDDGDLKDKVKQDLDLIAKELDEDHHQLEVGDRVMVTGPNHYEGEFAEIAEFSPSGKFVVVKFDNGDEASMHLSDIEFHDDQEDVEDWEDKVNEDEVNEDPTTDDETVEAPPAPAENPIMPESAPVKTITNECGLFEIHGNEPSGFEIRHGNNSMRSKFKTIDEAVMALEMFAARKKAQDESQDYIEEA